MAAVVKENLRVLGTAKFDKGASEWQVHEAMPVLSWQHGAAVWRKIVEIG